MNAKKLELRAVSDWKVSEKAQNDLKNVLEPHISTQNISGKIAKAKLKLVMATIRDEQW